MRRLVGLVQVFHEAGETVTVVTLWQKGDALTEHFHHDGYRDVAAVRVELEGVGGAEGSS